MKKTLKNIESHPLHTIGMVTVCIIVSIFIWNWSNSFEAPSASADVVTWCDTNMCSGLPYCSSASGDILTGDWNFSCVDGVGV